MFVLFVCQTFVSQPKEKLILRIRDSERDAEQNIWRRSTKYLVRDNRRILRSSGLNSVYCPQNIIRFTILNKRLEVKHSTNWQCYKFVQNLIKNSEGRNPVERTIHRSDNNIKKDCKHQDLRLWTGLIGMKVGFIGWIFENSNEPAIFTKDETILDWLNKY
jgi:hypothetical protein